MSGLWLFQFFARGMDGGRNYRDGDLEDEHGSQEKMTLFTVLAIGAGVAMLWMFGLGKKVQKYRHVKGVLKKLKKINRFDKKADEEAEKQVKSSGDNPVGTPWMRKK